MGKSIYNGTSPYEYVDFLERCVEDLEDEVERLHEDHKYACDVADNLRAEIKTLRNQAVANAKDAERYRWLRANYPYAAHIALTNTARGTRILIDDAAIDAARAGDAAE